MEDEIKKAFMVLHCKVCGTQRCGGIYDTDFAEGCQKYPLFKSGALYCGFKLRAADSMAIEVDRLIAADKLNSRSPLADARLEYSQPKMEITND